jgi:hypothetical protein
MIWYDLLYLLTAIGWAPGGSSTVHIYSQTIHRTQWYRIHRISQTQQSEYINIAIKIRNLHNWRSQWPRGLRRRSTAARLLRSCVLRISPGGMDVCCVLSGSGLCDELNTRPEGSCRLWRFVVCDFQPLHFTSHHYVCVNNCIIRPNRYSNRRITVMLYRLSVHIVCMSWLLSLATALVKCRNM